MSLQRKALFSRQERRASWIKVQLQAILDKINELDTAASVFTGTDAFDLTECLQHARNQIETAAECYCKFLGDPAPGDQDPSGATENAEPVAVVSTKKKKSLRQTLRETAQQEREFVVLVSAFLEAHGSMASQRWPSELSGKKQVANLLHRLWTRFGELEIRIDPTQWLYFCFPGGGDGPAAFFAGTDSPLGLTGSAESFRYYGPGDSPYKSSLPQLVLDLERILVTRGESHAPGN